MQAATPEIPSTIPHHLWHRLRTTLEMIQFEHSVFALPFGLLGAMLAARGRPSLHQLFWIVAAMVGARSAAMSFNRLIDRHLDARNPRTQRRALPQGKLSVRFVLLFALASASLLLFAAWQLNPLAFWLSPIALGVLVVYSYTKRFTLLSHLVLGLCLGIAPAAASVRGARIASVPAILLLTGAVTLWTAGFDVLYACQDVEFDRRAGLHSIPQRWGIRRALQISSALHVAMLALLIFLAYLSGLGVISAVGVAVVALLLAYEHHLVRPNDLSRLNAAFFTTNGWIGILLLLFWGADILLRR